MQVINNFTGELNNFADSFGSKNITNIGLAALRVAAFMATAGFTILSAASLFRGDFAGCFSCGLMAIGAHEVYQVAKNLDQGNSKHMFNNTIVLKPIANLIDRLFG